MANCLSNIPKNTNVYRFITSGKPGRCELCGTFVEKLEAHHIQYSPETTINLCHLCHHTSHFWPLRLSQPHRKKIFSKLHDEQLAEELSKKEFKTPGELACLIAPSRNAFIHAEQLKEYKKKNI